MELRLKSILTILLLSAAWMGCDKNPLVSENDGSIVWQGTSGPFGLQVYWTISLPDNRDFVSSTSGWWFETTDGGSSWRQTSTFPRYSAAQRLDDGSYVHSTWAQNGPVYFRSTDNCNSWQAVNVPQTSTPVALTISNTGVWFLAANQDGVYRSTNSGASWTRFTDGLEMPTNPSYLITVVEVINLSDSVCLALAGSYGVRRSTNLGQTWSITPLSSRLVFDLQQLDDHTVLAGSTGAIFRSTDRGEHWDSVSSKNGSSITPKTSDGRILALNGSGISQSLDDGLTWTHMTAPVSSGRIMVGSSGTLYAGWQLSGLFRSTDYGLTWQESYNGIVATSVTELTSIGDVVLAYHGGASRTTDLGATWTRMDLPAQNTLLSFSFSPSRGDTVYAGTSRLYQSINAGATWHRLVSADGLGTVTSVAANSTGEVFFGTYNGQVYRSRDGGQSWTLTNQSVYAYPVHRLASNSSGVVLMSDAWNRLAISTDHANTWNLVNTLPNEHRSIAVSPNGTLYVGHFDGIVYRSIDLGASWETKPLSNTSGHNVTSFDFLGNTFVVASSYGGGVYVSRDNGSTWSQANDGLSITDAPSVTAMESGYLLVGTHGAGVFRSSTPVR